MEIKDGEIVSLIHHSGQYTIMGIIDQVSGDLVEIITLQQNQLFSFFENDPIVIGCKINNEFCLCESIIINVDLTEHRLRLKVNNIRSNADKRLFERFPVSFYADIHDQNGLAIVTVKNIGLGGVGIIGHQDYPTGKQVKINLDIEKRIVSLTAKIVWKKRNENYIEYGLHFLYLNDKSKQIITDYILALKDEHEKNIKKYKIAYKKIKAIIPVELNDKQEACV